MIGFLWFPISQKFINTLNNYGYWSLIGTKLAVLSACLD